MMSLLSIFSIDNELFNRLKAFDYIDDNTDYLGHSGQIDMQDTGCPISLVHFYIATRRRYTGEQVDQGKRDRQMDSCTVPLS